MCYISIDYIFQCFERDLRNELLGLDTRLKLKKGAIPTLNGVLLRNPRFRCAVNICHNPISAQYFKFPSDFKRLAIWIAACNQPNVKIDHKTDRICSRHFSERSYANDEKSNVRILKNDAIPTQNLDSNVLTEIQSNVMKECNDIVNRTIKGVVLKSHNINVDKMLQNRSKEVLEEASRL